jgi:DNA-binding NtrC family response regulator
MGSDPDESLGFPLCGVGTILLVDDEEYVRSLGQRILEKSGYCVITADNGREAVAIYRYRKDEISLVILDLIMPLMDGRQCLREILKINPEAKVLVASGFSPDGGTQRTLEDGAKGFVGKPYNLKELLTTVRDVLTAERDPRLIID